MLVFWIAHVYAEVVARSVDTQHHITQSDVRRAMGSEWPILEAAIVPCAALALGAMGLLSDDASFGVALAVGVASMTAWCLVAARAAQLSRIATIFSVVASTLLGLLIVALKLVVH